MRVTTGMLGLVVPILAWSCGPSLPRNTGPSPLPDPGGPAAVPVVLRISAGPTGQLPVAKAAVVLNGITYITDDSGMVAFGGAVVAAGVPVEVQATGYLPRRTRVPSSNEIRLWPVASDAEAEALHQMAYGWGGPGDVFYPLVKTEPFTLTLLGATPEQRSAWTAGAASFGTAMGIAYRVSDGFQYDHDEVAIKFVGGLCTPDSALGFCRDEVNYKVFRVTPERSIDPVIIERLLAAWFLGPNPLPGLLSPASPQSSLSAFERQTIQMMTIRQYTNRWPDDDQDSAR
jgi:hypothetical protein